MTSHLMIILQLTQEYLVILAGKQARKQETSVLHVFFLHVHKHTQGYLKQCFASNGTTKLSPWAQGR